MAKSYWKIEQKTGQDRNLIEKKKSKRFTPVEKLD